MTDDCVLSQETRSILAEVFKTLTGMPELQCDCGPDTGEFEYTLCEYEDGYSVACRPRHHEGCPVIAEEERQMNGISDQVLKGVQGTQLGELEEFTIIALETLGAIEAVIDNDLDRRNEILRGSQHPPSRHAKTAFAIAAMVIEVSGEPEKLLDKLRRHFINRPWSRDDPAPNL